MFKLGVITDEVSQDINVAADFAVNYGLKCLEIRSVNGRALFDLTDEDYKEIKQAADSRGLEIIALSSAVFKCDINDKETVKEHIEGFERLAVRANQLGCKFIRAFDFWESGASLKKRAECFKPIIDICEKYDIICAVEFDPSVHSCLPQSLLEFINTVNSPYVKLLFDPGNAIFVDENAVPYPTDYSLVKDSLCHIHIKDADMVNGKIDAVKVGAGRVDYKGFFAALLNSGYNGAVMLETHYRKAAALTEEQLKLPGGNGFSEGAYPASCESIEAIIDIINSVK